MKIVDVSHTIIGDLARKTINDAGDVIPVRILVHKQDKMEIELVWNTHLLSWVVVKKEERDV